MTIRLGTARASALVRIGLVAEDLFATALGDEVGLAGERRDGVVEVLPEKDAAGLGPLQIEGQGVLEDMWGIGEEATVPEIGAAAVEDVEVVPVEVKAEGAGAFVFAVDDDDVGGFEFGGDGDCELSGGEDRRKDLQAEVRGDQEDEGCGDQAEVRSVGSIVATAEPVGQGSTGERDCGENERVAEGAHGLRVQVEEVAEGEGVVTGVLFEERRQVGVRAWWVGVNGEESGDQRGDGTCGE